MKVVRTEKGSNLFRKIINLQRFYYDEGKSFFFGWDIIRKYSLDEIRSSKNLYVKIKKTINSCGQENGTIYNDSQSCRLCGAGGFQINDLILDKKKIPNPNKNAVWKTIAGEIGVSLSFANILIDSGCPSNLFGQIRDNKSRNKVMPEWLQLKVDSFMHEFSQRTVSGINPFNIENKLNKSTDDFLESITPYSDIEKYNYKCPLGHTIGLNLLSEIFLKNQDVSIGPILLSWTKQCVGVRRGFLRPEHCLIIKPNLYKKIKKNKIIVLDFEIAHCDFE